MFSRFWSAAFRVVRGEAGFASFCRAAALGHFGRPRTSSTRDDGAPDNPGTSRLAHKRTRAQPQTSEVNAQRRANRLAGGDDRSQLWGPYEAMRILSAEVGPRNRTCRADALGLDTWVQVSARCIEYHNLAFWPAHEAVRLHVRIDIESRDGARRANTIGPRSSNVRVWRLCTY
jgi:hypothetical protein